MIVRQILAELARVPGLGTASQVHLVDVYGARAPAVAALAIREPDLAAMICTFSGAIAAEVVFAVRQEFALGMADILLRRCMAGLSPDLGRGALPKALSVAARYLDWDVTRLNAEQAAYEAEIRVLESFLPGEPVSAA